MHTYIQHLVLVDLQYTPINLYGSIHTYIHTYKNNSEIIMLLQWLDIAKLISTKEELPILQRT